MPQSKQRITIADVADRAGVTKTTVSRVLNNKGEFSEDTRQRVLRAVEDLGYRRSRLARGLALDQTRLLGLIVPSISSEFFTEIVRGSEDTAWEHDYKMVLCNTEGDWRREEDMILFLQDLQVDGIVVCAPRLPGDRLLPLIERFQNVVIVNGQGISWHGLAGAIQTDDASGMQQAACHLLASGRRYVTYLGGPQDARSSRERYRGFIDALEAAGYMPNLDWFTTCYPANIDGGHDAMLSLLSSYPEIDGVTCFNDLVAIGVIRACEAMGRRVPEDVAVVGCDDISLASLVRPQLTTLRTPKKDVGAIAMRMLLERINGQYHHELVCVPQTLIVRESAP